MTVREKIINYALDAQDKTRGELGLVKSGHWCAEFVSHIIDKALPNNNVTSISCTRMQDNMSQSNAWSEPDDDIKIGDIIFYNWEHDYDPTGNLDHVGIVVDVQQNFIRTIEGNTVNSENPTDPTNPVKLKVRYRNNLNFNCTYPDYYMRYTGDTPTTNPTTVSNPPIPPTTEPPATEITDAILNIQKALDKLKSIYHI